MILMLFSGVSLFEIVGNVLMLNAVNYNDDGNSHINSRSAKVIISR